mmetsp:Transcript_17221/g.42388  ORF Transcript_17221/g.42388 Transcript_17221/m.42388 type:complete len:83 (+) Transcript_17221:1095-1343(+)
MPWEEEMEEEEEEDALGVNHKRTERRRSRVNTLAAADKLGCAKGCVRVRVSVRQSFSMYVYVRLRVCYECLTYLPWFVVFVV